jgi:transcriptional regulator with XRE-family HTH domain
MIKPFVVRPEQQGSEAPVGSDLGSAVWGAVGQRLRRRRTQIGYSVDHVAQWAAIPVDAYGRYEKGAPIPAALLAQIADLFARPLVWFFQGVGQDAAQEDDDAEEDAAGPVVYRVATVEHRIAALVESFRKLDFEGQQHLLAISRALCRTGANAGAARD